jgi:glycosyltransferase involved in cell wall biosynthesis
MRISIALATFNGELHLRRQLESLAAQSRTPDELIVCDDCSSDSTFEILRDFASAATFPVRFYCNDEQRGVRKNFEKAVSLCEGDIIALCDQDDVWNPEKLKLIEQAFSSSNAGLVFSDAELVDANLEAERRCLWQAVGFDSKKKKLARRGRMLEVLLRGNVVSGATMAFRSKFCELILPIPSEDGLLHDGWIALIISAVANVALIEKPLIKYRQHPAQVVGVPEEGTVKDLIVFRKTDPDYYLEQVERYERVAERLVANESKLKDRQVLSILRRKIIHLRARAGMPAPRLRRLPLVVSETLNRHYHQYSNGWFSAAKDLLA